MAVCRCFALRPSTTRLHRQRHPNRLQVHLGAKPPHLGADRSSVKQEHFQVSQTFLLVEFNPIYFVAITKRQLLTNCTSLVLRGLPFLVAIRSHPRPAPSRFKMKRSNTLRYQHHRAASLHHFCFKTQTCLILLCRRRRHRPPLLGFTITGSAQISRQSKRRKNCRCILAGNCCHFLARA